MNYFVERLLQPLYPPGPGAPAPAAPASGTSAPGAPAAFRYLAREPILDRFGCVQAYELLFRDGPVSAFSGDGNLATDTMIDNAVLFGLNNLTNGSPGFINCTAETLIGDAVRVLPPALTVLEILEDVLPTPTVVDACRRLKAEGYRFALDDFIYRPDLEPFVQLADFIKIDYLNTSVTQRRETLAALRPFKGLLIAEKVETQAVYAQAREEGFRLFQGYYFCRPLLIQKHRVPANRAVHFRLLPMLQNDPLDFIAIDEVVKSEPALTYRLLRYVNSPLYGLRERVTSIRAALIAVGDDLFRRIVLLAVATELNRGSSNEILRVALVRARFCESMAILYNLHCTEQYLLGLFSLLPAMLQKPMDEAISVLPLRDPLRDALLGEPNDLRRPLEWLETYERGDFQISDALARLHQMDPALLCERFTEAALWADQLLSPCDSAPPLRSQQLHPASPFAASAPAIHAPDCRNENKCHPA